MKKLNILFLLFIAVLANAQTVSGTVKSKAEGSAVPFAKIGVEGEKAGTIADEGGKFSFDLTDILRDKTVKIEVGGYDVFKTSVADFIKQNPQNILLNEKVREIAEVKVSPKKLVEKNWGLNSKSKKMLLDFFPKSIIEKRKTYTEEQMQNNNREVAVLFKNSKRTKISRINMNFGRFNVEKPVKFRFVFYSEKDGKPDELLDFEEIFADIDNKDIHNGTYSLDISDKNIWVKGNFFVSAQLLTKDFEGMMSLSLGFFGGSAYYRRFVSDWEKLPMSLSPAINIDVKVEK